MMTLGVVDARRVGLDHRGSTWNGGGTYAASARGWPASRRFPSPPGSLPRVPIWADGGKLMGGKTEKRECFSGIWVSVSEALAWIRTRDAEFAQSMRRAPSMKLHLALSLRRAENGEAFALDRIEAERTLIHALRHGQISARGRFGTRAEATRSAEEMFPADWSDLRFELGPSGSFIAASEPGHDDILHWHTVMLHSAMLAAVFPALDDEEQAEFAELPAYTGLPSEAGSERAEPVEFGEVPRADPSKPAPPIAVEEASAEAVTPPAASRPSLKRLCEEMVRESLAARGRPIGQRQAWERVQSEVEHASRSKFREEWRKALRSKDIVPPGRGRPPGK